MSKAKELLEKLKQRREEAEAIQAYWQGTVPGLGEVSPVQMQSWQHDYDFETIIAGIDGVVPQRNKRDHKGEPMDARQAVVYASAIMRNLKDKTLSEEELEALKAKREHIRAVRSEAGKLGRAKQLQGFAKACEILPEVARALPTTLTGSSSGSSSLSSSHTGSGSAKPAAAAPPVQHLREEKDKGKTENRETNPAGASGSLANQRQERIKTLKTAKGDQPMPEGFDTWPAVERTKWVMCDCEPIQTFYDWPCHRPTCAAEKGQAKTAAANGGSHTAHRFDASNCDGCLGIDDRHHPDCPKYLIAAPL